MLLNAGIKIFLLGFVKEPANFVDGIIKICLLLIQKILTVAQFKMPNL